VLALDGRPPDAAALSGTDRIAAAPRRESSPADNADAGLFLNRELSMLAFNRRVFEEAGDRRNPMLERVKFLSIVGSNLDEFFMVRVAGLMQQVEAGIIDTSPDGMSPAEQLAAVRKEALALMHAMRRCWEDDLLPALDSAGVHVQDYASLSERHRQYAQSTFEELIFPVLTPLAYDPGRPFPHISNLSLNLAVVVRDADGAVHFARVKVPSSLPRLVPLKRSSGSYRRDGTVPHNHYFVWIEQLIAANLHVLFPGMEVIEAHPFRVTRDADMDLQEMEAADLLETVERHVRRRRFGSLVRLTINPTMPDRLKDLLMEELDVGSNDVYVIGGPLGLSSLMSLAGVDRHDLKAPVHVPAMPASLSRVGRSESIFSAVRRQDILLHHPYDSFTPVVEFIEAASRDPQVLAIKQTLYRVGRNSPVVAALLRARENGKQVAAVVELKARFDEASNIGWARMLEQEGVHVVYGLVGLKVHAKVALVVRNEGERIRRYVHLGTGNYNAVTAQLYTDFGLLTCDDALGADASDLFNYLTGYSAKASFRKLIVAPINMRERMRALILREIEHHREGGDGHLFFKMNALVDPEMIRLLYDASRAGVRVDLNVRGICCLRPGVPDVSENIRVVSLVGRFLEHSRVYYFRNGGEDEVYLGSADLMPRNIDRRVETLFPLEDRRLVRLVRDEVLAVYASDNVRTRVLQADGSYVRLLPGATHEPMDCQAWFAASRSVAELPPTPAQPDTA